MTLVVNAFGQRLFLELNPLWPDHMASLGLAQRQGVRWAPGARRQAPGGGRYVESLKPLRSTHTHTRPKSPPHAVGGQSKWRDTTNTDSLGPHRAPRTPCHPRAQNHDKSQILKYFGSGGLSRGRGEPPGVRGIDMSLWRGQAAPFKLDLIFRPGPLPGQIWTPKT